MAYLPSKDIQSRQILPFPDMEETPYKEKQKPKYSQDVAEYIYSMYTNNKTAINAEGLNTYFDTLRLFGKGKQPVEQYKQVLSSDGSIDLSNLAQGYDSAGTSSRSGNRAGWLNTIWETVSPLPNIKTMAKGKGLSRDYDIKADTIDIDSSVFEDEKQTREYVKSKHSLELDAMRKLGGNPTQGNTSISDSWDELEQIKKEGGFKPRYVLAIEQALRHMEQISYWDRSLREKLFDDLFDIGHAFSFPRYDDKTKKVKWEYLDPKDTIIQYSKYGDFRDATYGGRFEYMSINEIKTIQDKIHNAATGAVGLDKEDFKKIGNLYKEYEDNPSEAEWNQFGDDFRATRRFGDARVCVLHVYWKDVEKEKETEYTNSYGNKRTIKYSKKHEKNKDMVIKENRVKMIYSCSIIVGTDYLWDFGCMNNQPRITLQDPSIPIVGFKIQEKPYTERLIPVAHNFALSWLRFTNNIATSIPDFITINYDMLAEISDGDKKIKPLDSIRMMIERHVLLHVNPSLNQGGSNVPAQKVQGTSYESITSELNIMEALMRQVEILTGLSPVSLGAMPSAEAPVGTTEMTVSSSMGAISLITNGVFSLKADLGMMSIPMLTNSIYGDEEAKKAWASIIGGDDIETILEARENFVEYGIDLMARPTDQQKQELIQFFLESKRNHDQGGVGVTPSQFIDFKYQLDNGGNLLEIIAKFKAAEKREIERVRREKLEVVDRQAEAQKNASVAIEQEKQKSFSMEAQIAAAEQAEKNRGNLADGEQTLRNNIIELEAERVKEMGESPLQVLNKDYVPRSSPSQVLSDA